MGSNTAKKSNDIVVNESAPMQVVKNETEEVPDQEPVVEKPAAQPEISLEQRITMVEDLSMLIDKWRKLQESYRNLQSFKIGTDGMSTQITLRDSYSGKEFRTSNTAVVTKILEEIRLILLSKIAEVESQIRF